MELIKEMLMSSLLTLVVALVVTLVFGPVFIPWLRKLKFGQEIREEGPKWHQKKIGYTDNGRYYVHSCNGDCDTCNNRHFCNER